MLPRSLKFYLGVLGALLAAGFVVTVTAAASGVRAQPFAAASPKPSASPGATAKSQAYCDSFINHLASNLGKKPGDVQKAAASALDQTLDDAVKAGDLTRQQAVARLRRLTPFRDFITENEAPLRRIAENSTNLRWTLRYIEFILRTNWPRDD